MRTRCALLRALSRSAVVLTLVLAAFPDVIQMLPITGWWLFADGSFTALRGYAVAVPGQEPVLPPLVGVLSHHLHCVMHSAPIAALVTGAVWAARRAFWIPLLGWWSHIVIDVFTAAHPVPVRGSLNLLNPATAPTRVRSRLSTGAKHPV